MVPNAKGQYAVELALLLPLLFILILVFMQAWTLCQTALRLQCAAFQASRQAALDDRFATDDVAKATLLLMHWETHTRFPRLTLVNQPLTSWREYFGVAIQRGHGCIQSAQVNSTLWPHWIPGGWIPAYPIQVEALYPKDPPIHFATEDRS